MRVFLVTLLNLLGFQRAVLGQKGYGEMRTFGLLNFSFSGETMKNCEMLHRRRNVGNPVVHQYRDGVGSSELSILQDRVYLKAHFLAKGGVRQNVHIFSLDLSSVSCALMPDDQSTHVGTQVLHQQGDGIGSSELSILRGGVYLKVHFLAEGPRGGAAKCAYF